MSAPLMLVEVEPQPEYIDSSGRWSWPLKPPHDNDGRCPAVYDASRRWWEYAPDGAKPCPGAEALYLDWNGDGGTWYWVVSTLYPETAVALKADVIAALERVASHLGVPDDTPFGILPGACCEVVDRLKADLTARGKELAKRAETLRDRTAELRRVAQELGVEAWHIFTADLPRECIEAIDRLKATLRDADAEKGAAMRAFHSRTLPPWTQTGTPGSESPDHEERICLAIVAATEGPEWSLVVWSPGAIRSAWVSVEGDEVEVLEYWPLPPSDEGWEQVWRRKP